MRRLTIVSLSLGLLISGFVAGCSDDDGDSADATVTTLDITDMGYCDLVSEGRIIFASNRTDEEKTVLMTPILERARELAPADIQEAYDVYYLGVEGDVAEAQGVVDDYNLEECDIS